jgi:membrane protein YqaA with SNARE-associated domain
MHPLPVSVPVATQSNLSLSLRWSAISSLQEGVNIDRVRAFLHRFGGLSLSLAALLLPPFPTSAFVIGAGVTRYPFIAFVLSFDVGRACRFALLAYLASVFGRRFVTSM